MTEVNGWKIYAHPVFIEQFEALVQEVEQLRAEDSEGYRQKKKTKLLAAILKMAFEVIPQDPAHSMLQQGNTLGAAYRHWHRGKFFEGRYRLFFRFSSSAKAIVLAWVNDLTASRSASLARAGVGGAASQTDCRNSAGRRNSSHRGHCSLGSFRPGRVLRAKPRREIR